MNNIQIIVNNGAGTGSAVAVWKETKEYLQENGISYNAYLTRYEKHAVKLAGQICGKIPEGPIYLLVVGGDGTINEVLNGITDFDRVRLGVIPTGSGNDFARNLGILRDTREDLREITACIDQEQNGGKLQRIDLGKVSWEGCEKPRIFGISAGAGLDAIVCKKALHSKLKKILNRFHLGKLTYLMLTVQTLFSMRTFQANVTTNGETESYENMIFAAAMNLRAEGGGVPMAPESVPDDGKISLSSASGIPKWKTFFLLPLLAMGKQGRIRVGKVSWEGCEKPRIFGISAGAGLDAIVCKKALHSKLKKILNRFHLGKLTYLMLTVQTLFSMRTFQANVTTNGETESYENMIFAAAMNLRAEGGGVPMAPESVPDDGKISLSSASGIPKWKTFFLLPLLAMGKQGRIRGFDVKDGSEIVMELDQPVVLHADGEYCGDVQHICVHCMKNTLWLLHRCTEK